MRIPPQIRLLPDGVRLHLQDGPIDLIIRAFGAADAIERAYAAAARRFVSVLDELCAELPALRRKVRAGTLRLKGPIARDMERAVTPFAEQAFITPMAAVAGAVADHILAEMLDTEGLDRAFVNNGGDIALHVGHGQRLRIGMVDRLDRPSLFAEIVVSSEDSFRGVATSGWRGRSFSLGIADSVTVLARSAAEADAAATIIANEVDLPGHMAISRAPANSLQPDNDLGDRLVTRDVGPLCMTEIAEALASGRACAETLVDRDLIFAAALRLGGQTLTVGTSDPAPRLSSRVETVRFLEPSSRHMLEFNHA